MSTVIQLENLSKAYSLGVINRRIFAREWMRKLTGRSAPDDEFFWALRDVSFEVKDGEILGLLGRNGAGKSTLLKVVSQITTPTRGNVKLRGRVGSLLEVGTGFHPDLTGRENVFLNGAILGMRHREVAAKFDQIVEFSGVETFIDTPVKRYSVGMRVRLAFAVAAHLEPEILLVDEVLAVGDAAFQQKCLGKMGEVAKSGRTVVLVSHNSAAIEALCTRGIVLENGRVVFDGTQTDAIDFYASSRVASDTDLRHRTDRSGTGDVRATAIELRNARGEPVAGGRSGGDLEVVLRFERPGAKNFPRLAVQIFVSTHLGTPIFTQANWLAGEPFGELPERGAFVCRIPRLPLPAGHFRIGYRMLFEMRGKPVIDSIENALDLHVEPGDFFGNGRSPALKTGVCLVPAEWRIEPAVN